MAGEPQQIVRPQQEPMVHMTEVEVKQEDDNGAKNGEGLDLLGLEFSEIDHDDGGQNNVFCTP